MTEELQWIKQIRLKSNKTAANQLIAKYYKEMYAYVYKQTLNKELSLDLTQEIFIRVLQSIDNYDERKASFRTWVYRIATYRIVDYYRSKYYKYNSLVTLIDDYDIEDDEDFTISVEYKEDVEKVMEIANKLDISNQQVLRLKLFADYTFKEISEILQVPESTVKTKYYSAIRKIKKDLEEW
ncbi:RNA polymerase sigma-70 factor, ECF subfamily [Clostridium aceticum]|uniref:RNA polymerase sigma-70 factor, ECF subfamily n=1 Tax=Clostridium aceticum TaxID=84022 RepID=A0A0D8IDH7_9CLOT|nr:RNA polymerase sigma factor [Clostridium aceticum]AKL96590.1 RNA polymerase sigma-70 factor, ECF subfamily [Clostridium aceticum]KJF27256.1 RNA polymerase sigma-70 factor [Clostridium aceticum]